MAKEMKPSGYGGSMKPSGYGGGYSGGHSGYSGGHSGSMKPSGYGGGYSGGHSGVGLGHDSYGWYMGARCPCCLREHRLSPYMDTRFDAEQTSATMGMPAFLRGDGAGGGDN